MLVLIPLLAFAALSVGFRRLGSGWRRAALLASVPWALFLVGITEALTQFHALTPIAAKCCWMMFALLCGSWLWSVHRRAPAPAERTPGLPLTVAERAGLITLAVIAFLIAVTATTSAPNNWDAMEYHLPRVAEWISNRGVQFYPTLDWFQLDQPPLAEYGMLHLVLLYGSDRLVALVQFFAYIGCIAAASLVAGELGADTRGQVFAAVLAGCAPSAVLAASGTKNDLVLAYWILAAVFLLLDWRKNPGLGHSLGTGAAIGLAAFTKGTAYLFLPALLLGCFLMCGSRRRLLLLKHLPVITATAVLICLPLWVRNIGYAGSPFGIPYFRGSGSVEQRMFRNEHFSPPQVGADVLRNLALDAGVPSEQVNALSTRMFSAAMRAAGVDPNQAGQMSYRQGGEPLLFKVGYDPRDEFFSEDPVHLLLFLLACGVCLAGCGRQKRDRLWFAAGLIGAFVCYCALLRWAPSNERYVIPLIVLGSSFTAAVLAPWPRWAVRGAAGLVLLMAIPMALMNETRPLLTKQGLRGSVLTTPRDETYFFDHHRGAAVPFIGAAAAARASGCRQIGLDADNMHFEYPMMALLVEDGAARRIHYAAADSSTARYASPSAAPECLVVCLRCLHDPAKMEKYSARLPEVRAFGTVVLFGRKPGA